MAAKVFKNDSGKTEEREMRKDINRRPLSAKPPVDRVFGFDYLNRIIIGIFDPTCNYLILM